MWRRALPAFVAIGIMAACASPGAGETSEPPSAQPASNAPVDASANPYPGFEFERVVQMDASDLPDGIPVPVPAGGTFDDEIGAFEGELLAIDYDPRFYQTAVAFYGTWLAREGIDASPLLASGGGAAGWEFSAGGVPVRIEIGPAADGTTTQVFIYWG